MDEIEEVSFETFFRDHWSRVFRVIYRLVGDRDEAEDLTLEVFWRLYSQPPRSRLVKERLGWLYRVATNLGYNALRARRRRSAYEISAGRQNLVSEAPVDPEQAVVQSETRRRVQEVLSRMKPRQAKILVLRHSGLSYAEIAAVLKVSTGSVGTLLARAERTFADRYQHEEGDRNAST